MIIKNLEIQNKRIQINDIILDFSKTGVYILSGENGIGKTTLVEELVYQTHSCISFEESEQNQAYSENRNYELFAYMPQQIIGNKTNVRRYIQKGNPNVKVENIKHYLNYFDLEDHILDKKFLDLSGGEQVKVAFVTMLAKETPYLFLDEPTNNLDDSSVEQLKVAIRQLTAERTFIIVTHDPRIIDIADSRIIFGNSTVTQIDAVNTNSMFNRKIPQPLPYKGMNIARHLFLKPANMMLLIFCLFLLVGTFILNSLLFEINYVIEDSPLENVIFLDIGPEWWFEDFNWRAAERLRLDIESERLTPFFPLPALREIVYMEGVEEIILGDSFYFNMIHEVIFNHASVETVILLNPPDIMWDGYAIMDVIFLPEYLIEGRYPNDDAREVTVSRALLDTYFLMGEDEIGNAIGREIDINGFGHTIVGIHALDIAFISRHPHENFGFYRWGSDDFIQLLSQRGEEIDWVDYMRMPTLIKTYEGYEPALLKEILTRFPNAEIFSYTYSNAFMDSVNSEVIRTLYIRNMIQMSIASLFILMIVTEINKITKPYLLDFEIYYLDRMNIVKSLAIWNLMGKGVLFLGTLIIGISILAMINLFYSDDIFQLFFWELVPVTVLGVLLLEVPQTVYRLMKKRALAKDS